MRIKYEADHNDDSGTSPPKKLDGWTLEDLPLGDPPAQLVRPFISPDGSTILYGPGGRLKGFTALFLTREITARGERVCVLDFEGHPHEWGRRARAMGFTDAQLRLVDYRTPFSDYWPEKWIRGSMESIAKRYIRPLLDRPGKDADLVIVDSYTTAAGGDAALGGADDAMKFFKALTDLGRPALVLAHTAGGEAFPAKPFGSVFVHNLARETWAIDKVEDIATPDLISTTVELRNMKANTAAISPPQFIEFTFHKSGVVTAEMVKGRTPGLAELIRAALEPLKVALSTKEIASALSTRGEKIKEASIRRALERNGGWFTYEDDSKGVRRWRFKK